MAWIEKTGSGYRVGYRAGGKQHYRSAPDAGTARKLRTKIEQDIALHGRPQFYEAARAAPALGARLEAWLDEVQLSFKAQTLSSYQSSAVQFLRYLEQARGEAVETIPVTALNRESLTGFQGWLLARGRKRSTAVVRAKKMRLAWQWLYEGEDQRWLSPPIRQIRTRAEVVEPPTAPTWEQMDQVLVSVRGAASRSPGLVWLERLVTVLRCCGFRRSETLLLEWGDVDLERGTIRLRAVITKGGYSGRLVPMAPVLVEEMRAWARTGAHVVGAPEVVMRAVRAGASPNLRAMRDHWQAVGAGREVWAGRPCHAFRKGFSTGVELAGTRREVTEYLVGHQPAGTGGRHYIDAERAMWPELVAAVGKIPALPARVELEAAEAAEARKVVRLGDRRGDRLGDRLGARKGGGV